MYFDWLCEAIRGTALSQAHWVSCQVKVGFKPPYHLTLQCRIERVPRYVSPNAICAEVAPHGKGPWSGDDLDVTLNLN